METKKEKRKRRHAKIRKKIIDTKNRPRLVVFRSNQHIYAQIIDDSLAKVLASASDLEIKKPKGGGKLEVAKQVGRLIAQRAKENKIESVIFDRGGFLFHGRIKSLAEGAREEGLKF